MTTTERRKFRKKPVVIEAVLFNGGNGGELREFVGDKLSWNPLKCQAYIETLEGTMTADAGDWIIKGVKGEFYPCKPDIFEATYEVVSMTTTEYSDLLGPLRERITQWRSPEYDKPYRGPAYCADELESLLPALQAGIERVQGLALEEAARACEDNTAPGEQRDYLKLGDGSRIRGADLLAFNKAVCAVGDKCAAAIRALANAQGSGAPEGKS